jgi:cation/acetate symporter
MTDPLTLGAIVAVAVITAIIGARGLRVAKTPEDFLVAARRVPSPLNASAISGEYLSAASFLGIAGLAMQEGLGALWYAVGYAAGYLVLLAAVAAPLRRFGAYTIPDFAEGRLDSPILRRAATVVVLLICGFYLLPQLKGAGLTLEAAVGTQYWVGVVVLGAVVTLAIASGGMRGITMVQAFQYWLKLVAIAVPALALLFLFNHPAISAVRGPQPPVFHHSAKVEFSQPETIGIATPILVLADGEVDGHHYRNQLTLSSGEHQIGAGTTLVFPAGSLAPSVTSQPVLNEEQWESPLLHLGARPIHTLAATYGVVIATFLGAIGLPHILVRFYTNPDGPSARRTTALVILLLACFYLFPAIFALLGRLEAPQLYATGQTDSVVLVLPRIVASGVVGVFLAALVAAGAFAAFLSTSSGLLISMAGAISHDLLGRGVKAFRLAAVAVGVISVSFGLLVSGISINVLVGWAFAIAASSFCPLLILGIWWSGLTWVGALFGLAIGAASSSIAVVATILGAGRTGWPAVLLAEPAIWTVPLAFATMIGVSKATPGAIPSDITRKLLALHLPEQVRLPESRRLAEPI